jgi:hypothetical protein
MENQGVKTPESWRDEIADPVGADSARRTVVRFVGVS